MQSCVHIFIPAPISIRKYSGRKKLICLYPIYIYRVFFPENIKQKHFLGNI